MLTFKTKRGSALPIDLEISNKVLVTILLDREADDNFRNKSDKSGMIGAIAKRNIAIVEQLLKKGSRIPEYTYQLLNTSHLRKT